MTLGFAIVVTACRAAIYEIRFTRLTNRSSVESTSNQPGRAAKVAKYHPVYKTRQRVSLSHTYYENCELALALGRVA